MADIRWPFQIPSRGPGFKSDSQSHYCNMDSAFSLMKLSFVSKTPAFLLRRNGETLS